MNEAQNNSAGPGPDHKNNPWKIGAFATAGAVLLLVAAGFTFAAFTSNNRDSTEQPEAVSQAAPRAAAPQPAAAPVPVPVAAPAPAPNAAIQAQVNCDQYRLDAQRDNMRVAKDGAIGAVIGGGTGAAGGAIADGGSGAGKGAGIGAVVGAVAGGAYGMTQENARVADAERAYQDCLNRSL